MARAFGFICRASLASMCLLSTLSGQTAKHPSESASGLLEQFESTTVFWEQFLVAKKIVALHDTSVLPHLEPWLRCEDMRRRGNAAFIFARLGDGRVSHYQSYSGGPFDHMRCVRDRQRGPPESTATNSCGPLLRCAPFRRSEGHASSSHSDPPVEG